MSAVTSVPGPRFAERHPSDRAFFLSMLTVVWAAILSGFIYNNVKKFMAGELTYPWIVHVHALCFVGWLVLFTAQILLVRTGRVATHRRLGIFGAVLAAAMLILGVATALLTERMKFGTPAADARFISVMLGDMLCFGGLVAAGILLRSSPAAHKRLMLVATVALTDAGFGRWLSPALGEWLGQRNFWELSTFAEGMWPFVRFQMLPIYLLIFAIGVYDLITRKRMHRAYLFAVAWCLPIHLLAGWLYFQPFWKAAATRMIGH
jgi:hypothetical protein